MLDPLADRLSAVPGHASRGKAGRWWPGRGLPCATDMTTATTPHDLRPRRRPARPPPRLRRHAAAPAPASGASRPTAPAPLRVVQAAVEQGVDFIDTADSYGPLVSEQIIAEALHPYPEDLVIGTKAGLTRHGPGHLDAGRPPGLPQAAGRAVAAAPEGRPDRPHPAAPHRPARSRWPTSSAPSPSCKEQGKVRHIGVSEVSVEELKAAREITDDRQRAEPLQPDQPAEPGRARLRRRPRASPSSRGSRSPPVTWPRPTARSPTSPASSTPRRPRSRWPGCCRSRRSILPIPGTKSVEHLTENLGAATADPVRRRHGEARRPRLSPA